MNLKQLEAFVQVAEEAAFQRQQKNCFDTAHDQFSYFFTGERTECKAVCEKYQRGKSVGRWN